ncbi:MAG: hypothetical protein J7M14_03145 [Planctomycetes bacterium]|nr:hypothetical protein [Planctomycetota bacterium]
MSQGILFSEKELKALIIIIDDFEASGLDNFDDDWETTANLLQKIKFELSQLAKKKLLKRLL